MLPVRCHHAFGELTPLRARPFLALLFLPLMLFGCGEEAESATAALGGDKAQGAELTRQLGCGSCHVIPGIEGANGLVGPSLSQVGDSLHCRGAAKYARQHGCLVTQSSVDRAEQRDARYGS